MSKVIIFTNENGGVSVCTPTGDLPIEEVQIKDIPTGIQSFIIDDSNLPYIHNDFFDAWQQQNGIVSINLEKAKNITKNRLRIQREPLLQKLDVAFQRALEEGSDTKSIVAEKQRLRDITKLPDQCQSLDELRLLKVE